MGGPTATRIRDSSQQVLLSLPAAYACKGPSGRILAVGSGSGEDARKLGKQQMSVRQPTNSLAPWANQTPSGWQLHRLGNVAEIRFSNVDKHTFEEEVSVRLCNYVDVYNNDRITADIDFMEASADQREINKFQLQ